MKIGTVFLLFGAACLLLSAVNAMRTFQKARRSGILAFRCIASPKGILKMTVQIAVSIAFFLLVAMAMFSGSAAKLLDPAAMRTAFAENGSVAVSLAAALLLMYAGNFMRVLGFITPDGMYPLTRTVPVPVTVCAEDGMLCVFRADVPEEYRRVLFKVPDHAKNREIFRMFL